MADDFRISELVTLAPGFPAAGSGTNKVHTLILIEKIKNSKQFELSDRLT